VSVTTIPRGEREPWHPHGAKARPGRALLRPWPLVAVGVVLVSILFVVVTGTRPAYDAYGWLVWGREALHGSLNTDAAPSWKPMTFLFALVYAPAGRAAVWLWMVTAVAGALAGAIFAGRIAYRLTGGSSRRAYPRLVAAAFAACGVLGIIGYWHFVLIAYSDPMDITLALAAIDCQISRRPRPAWALLVLLALARPEAWPVVGLYAVWAWRSVPAMRGELAAGVLAIPALWFGVSALTSPSWFGAGHVALGSTSSISGNKLSGVIHNFRTLYELPMQVAMLFALVVALVYRERTWLLLAGAALLWLLTEYALALGGYAAPPRYMFEPAAVMVVLTGAAIGRVLSISPRHARLRWGVVAAVAGLVVALAPHAWSRVRDAHTEVILLRGWARQIQRLHAVVVRDGGAKRILACGRATTNVSYQSVLAWELGRNVGDVEWLPSASIRHGYPVVWFEPQGTGWRVLPVHVRSASCRGLATQTAFN
jgi:hypothetical protein